MKNRVSDLNALAYVNTYWFCFLRSQNGAKEEPATKRRGVATAHDEPGVRIAFVGEFQARRMQIETVDGASVDK